MLLKKILVIKKALIVENKKTLTNNLLYYLDY